MGGLASVDLNLLVALDLLLETRSVRGAARRAHVTPSAMSHTLARLRVLLEDEVLVRAGHEMVPTPRALALAEPVRDLLAHAQRVLQAPERFDPARLRRSFRLACTDHVSTVLLRRAEPLLRSEAPGVDLYELPVGPDTMDRLRTGEIDAGVGVFPVAPPEVRVRRLFDDGFVTVVRPDHPRVRGPVLSLDDFLAEGHLLVAPRGTPTGAIDDALAERGLGRRVARTVPSFLSALWLAAESDLLLTVSRRLVAAVAPRLPLRVLPTPLPIDDYTLVLAWHPRVDAAVEDVWFRGVLVRAAQALEVEDVRSRSSST